MSASPESMLYDQVFKDYLERFGPLPAEIKAFNWFCQRQWFAALQVALETGVAVTVADLDRRMGPPDYENDVVGPD